MTDRLSYDQLPTDSTGRVKSAWGQYGDADRLGAVNLQTAERTRAAAALVRTGERFVLSLPLDQPNPPFFGRQPYRHDVTETFPGQVLDDSLDGLYPQSGTQWDALSHFGHPIDGFYNGVTVEQVLDDGELGIEGPASVGMAARGVLLDVARWAQAQGKDYAPDRTVGIPAEWLTATADAQGVQLRPGDVLCIRTGWVGWYNQLGVDQRRQLSESSQRYDLQIAGLAPAEGIARLVWDTGITALALDNPGVEPFPPVMGATGPDTLAMVHVHVMAMLGVHLGEFFDLDALAAACASDGRYDFFFVSTPLRIPGGIGSPPNAIAVR